MRPPLPLLHCLPGALFIFHRDQSNPLGRWHPPTDKKVGGLIALSAQPSARLTALLVSPDSSPDGGDGFGPVLMLSGTAAVSVANLTVQGGAASGSDQMRSAIH